MIHNSAKARGYGAHEVVGKRYEGTGCGQILDAPAQTLLEKQPAPESRHCILEKLERRENKKKKKNARVVFPSSEKGREREKSDDDFLTLASCLKMSSLFHIYTLSEIQK
jgi:hypothetical protein